MTTSRTTEGAQVLFCTCAHYDIVPEASKGRILSGLSQAGLKIEMVDDLCGLAANRDPRLRSWAQAPSLAIVACFPRAIRWLFHAAGVPPLNGQVRVFNMRTQMPEEIISAISDCGLRTADSGRAANHQSAIINPQSGWVPWFPVIDYDRCKSCKQCLNFCLFGVYDLSEQGRVEVRKPSGCKTNCPACARMCPQKAIIFPKYGEAPINGDEVVDSPASADAQNPASPRDLRSLVQGDVYDKIRQRTAGHKRFSVGAGRVPKRNEMRLGSPPRACPDGSGQPRGVAPTGPCPTLESLRRELGIPDDVLKSLSPTDIARITKEARQNSPERRQGGADNDTGGRKKEAS